MNVKRALKATLNALGTRNLSMMFAEDQLLDDMEELSPGKTIGEEGELYDQRLQYVRHGNSYLRMAMDAYHKALKTYEEKRPD